MNSMDVGFHFIVFYHFMVNKFYCRVLHVFHFIDDGFPRRHSKTMQCCVDEVHFIEEMFSNPRVLI